MGIWQSAPKPRQPKSLEQSFSDLGSQLEDLITHVMRCERWARFDDRLDLAWAVEGFRRDRPQPRRADGGPA